MRACGAAVAARWDRPAGGWRRAAPASPAKLDIQLGGQQRPAAFERGQRLKWRPSGSKRWRCGYARSFRRSVEIAAFAWARPAGSSWSASGLRGSSRASETLTVDVAEIERPLGVWLVLRSSPRASARASRDTAPSACFLGRLGEPVEGVEIEIDLIDREAIGLLSVTTSSCPRRLRIETLPENGDVGLGRARDARRPPRPQHVSKSVVRDRVTRANNRISRICLGFVPPKSRAPGVRCRPAPRSTRTGKRSRRPPGFHEPCQDSTVQQPISQSLPVRAIAQKFIGDGLRQLTDG